MPGVTRRAFLAGSAAAGFGLASSLPVLADDRPMPTRALGKTGLRVSLVGLGTAGLGRRRLEEKEAIAIVHRAIELGINYIDTAPSYNRTHAERRLGLALKGARNGVVLATKTLKRDKKGALLELEASLRRLRTDHVDLWQLHALTTTKDTDLILGEEGALAAALEAKKAGKVRFVGITGHFDPTVFTDALKRHPFDSVLIPINCIDPHHRSFEASVLPFALKRGVGVIGMKVYCSGNLVKVAGLRAEDCLRYTCGLPVSCCIVGCLHRREVELVARVARELEPLDEKERAALWAKTKPHTPHLEWYKRKV
jgi:aryl-alcohol dehydrogenase-like predicted oxidoreductase